MVGGEVLTEFPQDLYIPPHALEILIDDFEGPLDLLLYLIKRQNIDIRDINIADITDQYMAYLEMMQAGQFELAAEYLVMAATLAEIKSRILLPRQPPEDSSEEEDPRRQLIRQLQQYEQCKQAARELDRLPRLERDIEVASAALPPLEQVVPEPEVALDEVLLCLARVLQRSRLSEHHHIQFETLSTREKMAVILRHIPEHHFVPWISLLLRDEGRLGVVVSFLAVMELMKGALIDIVQSEPFGLIHLRKL